MAKSKTIRGDKEFDLLDRLKKENKKLKRTNTTLRRENERLKSYADIDVDKYEGLQKLAKQRREERQKREKGEKEKRKCFECEDGYMILETWPRRDGVYYNRVCNQNCGNKTQMKKYHKDVKK